MIKQLNILMSAYNSAQYIGEAIESILKQNPKNCKVTLNVGIDGCEETLEAVKEFKDNINLYYSENNVGTYIIKNSLFSTISNKKTLILTFDSDDYMVDGFLYPYIKSYRDGILRLKCDNIKDGKKISASSPEGTILTKYEIFNKLGGYNEFRVGQDTDLINRARRMGIDNYRDINLPAFKRRIHESSLTKSVDTGHGSNFRKDIIRKNRELMKTQGLVAPMQTTPLIKI